MYLAVLPDDTVLTVVSSAVLNTVIHRVDDILPVIGMHRIKKTVIAVLDLSLLTAASALDRKDSRGAHSREDYTERDDDNFLKHSLSYLEEDSVRLEYKDVDTSIWEPKPRTY